jgi:hypothetical protein
VATQDRAWQRPRKNGNVDVFVTGGGVSMRLVGPTERVGTIVAAFAEATGVTPSFTEPLGRPAVIEGQTDIFEQLGASA